MSIIRVVARLEARFEARILFNAMQEVAVKKGGGHDLKRSFSEKPVQER